MKRLSFTKALEVLNMNKGNLMRIAYGVGYRGIDSAIPQPYADTNGMTYGNKKLRQNLFFIVWDGRNNLIGDIVYMPDVIPQRIKTAIINKAIKYNEIIMAPFNEPFKQSLLDEYYKFDNIIISYENRMVK